MFDTKSDYAFNKLDPDAIVYKSATGVPIRLTREDFASEEEFQRWKAWSDSDYHDTENAEHIHSNHTLPMQEPSETALAVSSPEDALIEVQEQQERQKLRRLLMTGLADCLTPTQRRRLWLYCVDGLSEEEISLAENVKQQNVSKAIQAAKRKLEKFLKNRV